MPSYPYHHRLVTRLVDGDEVGDMCSVISIMDIDPCGVCFRRCDTDNCWYVSRLEGLDTVP